MAQPILFCPGCNVKYRAKKHDASKTYKCPKCGQPLEVASVAGAAGTDGALDTQGKVEQDQNDPLVGQTIDQYRILKKLGEGAMGAVYQAEHVTLKRHSALKMLPEHMLDKSPDAVERFMREARAAASLSHPNIVTVYGVGESGGRHFIDMEFVEGEDLQSRLKREARLPLDEATRIVRDAAKGLGAAHAKNIVHRDVKAGNIMIAKDGAVKVMDFGLAKQVEADAHITVSGTTMGTPYYMSPEQCNGEELDGRADIYSLGVTYFSLLTGEPPFKGATCLSIMLKHKTEPPPDARSIRDDLPPEVCRIIEKALEKDRDARYQTCDELVQDLEAVLDGEALVVAKRSLAKPARALLRKPWFIAAASMLLIAGIVGVTWTLASHPPRRTDKATTGGHKEPMAAKLAKANAPQGDKPQAPQTEIAPPTQKAKPKPKAKPHAAALTQQIKPKPAAKPATPTKHKQIKPKAGQKPARQHKPKQVKKKPAAPPKKPKPKVDAVAKTKAALEKLDRNLVKLTSLRRYKEALGLCDEAKRKSGPKAIAKRVELWRRQLKACQEVLGRGRSRAEQLVGKTYKVQIKVGARGRMRVAGKVVKVENDTLFLRVGAKEKAIPISELGPNEIVSLGSGKGMPSAAESVTHARFLLVEGCDKDAGEALDRAQQQALNDPDAAKACAQAKAFFTFWNERQQKAQKERDAQLAIQRVKDVYRTGRWAKVPQAAAKLRDDFADTQAYADAQPLIAVLLNASEKHQALSKAGRYKRAVWRRLGPTVQVPDDDGKPDALPAGVVSDVAFLPDMKSLAVAHSFGVDVWDLKRGAIVRRLDGHKTSVTCLDYLEKGKLLATGASDGTICLWEPQSGKLLHQLKGAEADVRSLRFSPDGARLASVSHNSSIRLWDVAEGRSVARLGSRNYYAARLTFGPRGSRLLCTGSNYNFTTKSNEKTAVLWDVEKKRLLCTINDCPALSAAAFSPDGKRVAVGCKDGTVRLVDAEKGTTVKSLKGHGKAVNSVAFHPKGKLLACGSTDSTIRLLKVPSGKEGTVLTLSHGGYYGVSSVNFSADGQWLMSPNGTYVEFWNLRKGLEQPIERKCPTSVYRARFSPDGRWAVAFPYCCADFKLYRMPAAQAVAVVKGYGSPLSMSLGPDASYVAFGSPAGGGIWSLENSKQAPVVFRELGRGAEKLPIALSPDGQSLASIYYSEIRLFDARSGKLIRSFKPPNDNSNVYALAWSPDGKLLASARGSRRVRIWNPAAGKQVHMLEKTASAVSSLAFSPDSRRLLGAGWSMLYFWDAQTGAELKQLKMQVSRICFDPAGRWLVCAFRDKVVFLDAATGKKLRGLIVEGGLESFCISADGKLLAYGCSDGAVRVVDTQTGEMVHEFHRHRAAVYDLAFSRSTPPVLVSGSADGTVCVWRIGVSAEKLPNPGAKELVWIDKLFSATDAPAPLLVDLNPDSVAVATQGSVKEQESMDLRPSADWLGGAQLRWNAAKQGDLLKLKIDAPRAGKYLVGARITRSPGSGAFELSLAGKTIGEACDCFDKKTRAKGAPVTAVVKFGTCSLKQGRNEIELEVAGKNDASKGYALGIDAIILWPQQ